MQGFFDTDPNASDQDAPIYISEIVQGLQAVTDLLNTSGKFQLLHMSHESFRTMSGLHSAANILANLIAERMTGEDVVLKPPPRKRKPRARKPQHQPGGNVVPIKG